MDLTQIEKLNELKEKGMISDEEYQAAKSRILGSDTAAQVPIRTVLTANNYDYAMVMHLTQFCSWLFPFLGLIVPLIMWQTKKEDPYVDQQGRVVMNWLLSSLIYVIVSIILCFVLIGFLLLAIIFICSLIFTIMGAIDANKGIIKNYPLTIKFFAVEENIHLR
jgi:uncharacterized protein